MATSCCLISASRLTRMRRAGMSVRGVWACCGRPVLATQTRVSTQISCGCGLCTNAHTLYKQSMIANRHNPARGGRLCLRARRQGLHAAQASHGIRLHYRVCRSACLHGRVPQRTGASRRVPQVAARTGKSCWGQELVRGLSELLAIRSSQFAHGLLYLLDPAAHWQHGYGRDCRP